jgi:hypothetical protein
MTPHLEELLRPSLSRKEPLRAPFTGRTGLLVAFFGGPFAATAIQLLNGWRLRRSHVDAPLLLLGLAAFLVLDAWLRTHDQLRALAASWGLGVHETARLVSRLAALALFAFGTLLHRDAQRSADLMGLDRPHGFLPGLGLVLAGIAAQTAWVVAIS